MSDVVRAELLRSVLAKHVPDAPGRQRRELFEDDVDRLSDLVVVRRGRCLQD